ncbi:MAG: hypothetical protein AB7P17_07260 [Nitrospirales bacterium]
MKRFKKIIKLLLGLVAVVPFSLIGVLVVATISKPGLKKPVSGEMQHHEATHAVPSPTKTTDGRTVVNERPDLKISQLSQPGCLDVGKPCEMLTGQRIGVWGETVLKRKPS